mgnify:FL=1
MGNGNGNGNGHHHDDDHANFNLLDDDDLAEKFAALVSAAQIKGLSGEDIGYGLVAAAIEFMLERDHAECCVMQMLVDSMASYYDTWHDALSAEEDEPEDEI